MMFLYLYLLIIMVDFEKRDSAEGVLTQKGFELDAWGKGHINQIVVFLRLQL